MPTVVSVPEQDDDEPAAVQQKLAVEPLTRHTEIQYHLLKLGAELGLDVWVARNDRSRSYNGEVLGAMASMLDELPTQFNDATNRTIELMMSSGSRAIRFWRPLRLRPPPPSIQGSSA